MYSSIKAQGQNLSKSIIDHLKESFPSMKVMGNKRREEYGAEQTWRSYRRKNVVR